MLKIGKVAEKSRVGVETVRFYEREGLISKPTRTSSGYRQYSESVIRQIQFIQHAKTLGFSLKEIGELIKLKSTPNARCKGIRERTEAKITDIEEKILALEKIKEALQPLVDQCKASDPIIDCPILSALDEDTDHV